MTFNCGKWSIKMKIIKLLFTKEDIKYARRWIICSIGIFIMGFATLKELIIAILGIFPILVIINIIQLIHDKVTSKNKEETNK